MLSITLDSQSFDTSLTLRTFRPFTLRTFITTNMNIFRWEDIHNFCQYIIDKGQYAVVTCTQYLIGYSPYLPNFIRTTGTSQMGISSQCSLHMSRKVNFRNNSDITIGSISYDFFCFFLSVETTIRFPIIFS